MSHADKKNSLDFRFRIEIYCFSCALAPLLDYWNKLAPLHPSVYVHSRICTAYKLLNKGHLLVHYVLCGNLYRASSSTETALVIIFTGS